MKVQVVAVVMNVVATGPVIAAEAIQVVAAVMNAVAAVMATAIKASTAAADRIPSAQAVRWHQGV